MIYRTGTTFKRVARGLKLSTCVIGMTMVYATVFFSWMAGRAESTSG